MGLTCLLAFVDRPRQFVDLKDHRYPLAGRQLTKFCVGILLRIPEPELADPVLASVFTLHITIISTIRPDWHSNA
jgi:hypothetical protein